MNNIRNMDYEYTIYDPCNLDTRRMPLTCVQVSERVISSTVRRTLLDMVLGRYGSHSLVSSTRYHHMRRCMVSVVGYVIMGEGIVATVKLILAWLLV